MDKWKLRIINLVAAAASPAIVEGLRVAVQEWVVKAETTPNPWDDILVGIIQMLIGKPGDPLKKEE